MDKHEKLARDVTRLLFEEDAAALKDFFLAWKKDLPNEQAARALDHFEGKLWELRAALFAPGNQPNRQEVEEMLRVMFLLISQGGSSVG